jgi:hypothetical protein
MLFNSFEFLLVFLPIAYVVFWRLRSAQARHVWLTVTGYVFYGYWNPWFCLLMAFSTLVSYSAGLGFLRWHGPAARRLCLALPITVDLLLLGFFKYANFVMASTRDVVRLFGADLAVPAWNIILPVGISFYTFHTITYIVDCYRGTIKPTRNLFEFSAYVSLFSQLVAGRSCVSARSRRTWSRWAAPTAGAGWRWACRSSSMGWSRRCWSPTRWRSSSTRRCRRTDTPPCPRAGPGWRCSATRFSSISTSAATATWRWGSATCSACASR